MPRISVLIATRNRAKLLESTLEHFAALQTNGVSWEAIVVDNGSTDATPAVLDRARQRLPLTALHEPRPGKNCAMNRALGAARGDLLVFTDDDIEPDPHWLAEHAAAAARWEPYAIFGGPVVPKFPPETPERIQEHPRLAAAAFAKWQPAQGEGPCPELPYGPNFAIRAQRLAGLTFSEQMGSKGADTDLMGGETELLRRLWTAGERPVFVPAAPVRHVITASQLDRGWLLRRMFRQGRTNERLYPDSGSARLCGAPRYLVRKLVESWARFAAGMLHGEEVRFEAGLDFYYLRGRVYEYLAAAEQTALSRMLHP